MIRKADIEVELLSTDRSSVTCRRDWKHLSTTYMMIDSDFTHLGTSFHSFEETIKQFSVKTGPQVCEILTIDPGNC
jgi:hypothetical protein